MPELVEDHKLDWVALLFVIILLAGIFERVLPRLTKLLDSLKSGNAPSLLVKLNDVLLFVLSSLAVISIAGITFVLIQMARMRKQKILNLIRFETTPVTKSEKRWERILELASSSNPSDWKVAIIEADTILDEIVTVMGFAGDTLGEKLKGIEISDFLTLEEAWDRLDKLHKSKLVPFGSTAHPAMGASKDKNLLSLLYADTEYVTIFGKSWDLHVKDVLRIGLEDNLKII